jgi:sodium-dependent dicarboxylate transporter 2/3/5
MQLPTFDCLRCPFFQFPSIRNDFSLLSGTLARNIRSGTHMNEPALRVSDGEERFEQLRQKTGLILAPVALVTLWVIPFEGLSSPAHHLLAVLGAVVTLWMTEAIPLPITALLGPTLCVVLGIGPAREVLRSFADPIIFLFLGSFLLAEGMLRHGLNRRIAFLVLASRAIGESPTRLLFAFAGLTGLISMWVSNTATTAMMFPIGVAILSEMALRQSERVGREVRFTELKFGTGLMLVTAFAASIGGLATPVGTPPNLIGAGLIERHLNLQISFFQWMCFGVPLSAVLVVFLAFHLNRACPAEPGLLANSAAWLQGERIKLGAIRPGERNVLLAFGLTVGLWLLPGVIAVALGDQHPTLKWMNRHFPEAIVALLGGLLLFLLPVNLQQREFTLSWNEAKGIDWGTILLFGGGLALGELMFSTGLAQWLGEGLAHRLQADSTLGLVMLFTAVAIFLSETTSNTASATMVIPVAIAVAQGAGVDPLAPAMAACLGASMGFMLPVSTPPNAIVYGSGCVPLLKMVRHGVVLDIAGFIAIVPVATWLIPWLLRA